MIPSPICSTCGHVSQEARFRKHHWIGLSIFVGSLLLVGMVSAKPLKRLTLTNVNQDVLRLRDRLERVESILDDLTNGCGEISSVCKPSSVDGEKEVGEKSEEEVVAIAPSCISSCKGDLVGCLKQAGENTKAEKVCAEKSDGCYRRCDTAPPAREEISCLGKCKESLMFCVKDSGNDSYLEKRCVISNELCFKGCQNETAITPITAAPTPMSLPLQPVVRPLPLTIPTPSAPPISYSPPNIMVYGLNVRETTTNSIRVDWTVFSSDHPLAITHYEIRLWRNRTERVFDIDWPNADLSWGVTIPQPRPLTQDFVIRDLAPNTNYVVGLRGCRANGECYAVSSVLARTRS